MGEEQETQSVPVSPLMIRLAAFAALATGFVLLYDPRRDSQEPLAPVQNLRSQEERVVQSLQTVTPSWNNDQYLAVAFDKGIGGYDVIHPIALLNPPYVGNDVALALKPGSLEELSLSKPVTIGFGLSNGEKEGFVGTTPRFAHFKIKTNSELGSIPAQFMMASRGPDNEDVERGYALIRQWNESEGRGVFYINGANRQLSFMGADLGEYQLRNVHETENITEGPFAGESRYRIFKVSKKK